MVGNALCREEATESNREDSAFPITMGFKEMLILWGTENKDELSRKGKLLKESGREN